MEVSIHAPAWGATNRSQIRYSRRQSFNPRARVGRDFEYFGAAISKLGFNPRARVGRDYTTQ